MVKSRLFLAPLLLSVSLSAQHTVTHPAKTGSLRQLRQQLEQLIRPAQGRVGVAVRVIETGESVSLRGNERFPMQSVYKFPIGMAVLHQVDQGKLSLNQLIHVDKSEYVGSQQHSPIRDSLPNGSHLPVGDLLRYAVSESDGSASDVLLRLAGGPMVVANYLNTLTIKAIRVVNTEKELGQNNAVQYANWATPTAMVSLLTALQQGQGLSPASRAFLLRLMTETPTGPNRIKGLLPPGTVVAHKTGSSTTIAGLTAATNDVGLITLPNGHHLAIAIFVADANADTPTREAVIAKVAKAVWLHWR